MRQHQFERICDQILEEKRWRRFQDLRIIFTPKGFPVRAHLALNDRRIQLTVSRRFEPLVQSMIQKHQLGVDTESACEAIVYHLLVHEYNHHHYCPQSVFLFEQIINGIRRVVEKKEIRESNIRRVCLEIHNMFSDTVINAIESQSDQSKRYRLGQDLAQLLVLFYRSQTKWSGKSDKAMRLFLESNMLLSATSDEIYEQVRHYLPKFLWNQERIVRDIIELFLQEPALVERTLTKDLLDCDATEIVKRLCDYKQWPVQAEDYARIIYPYLKQSHEWLENAFAEYEAEPAALSKIREARFGNSRGRKGEAGTTAQAGNGDLAPGKAAGQPLASSYKRQFRSDPAVGTKEKPTPESNNSATPLKGAGTSDLKKHDYESLNRFYEERAGNIRLEGELVDQSLEVLTGIEETDLSNLSKLRLSSSFVLTRPDGSLYLSLKKRSFPLTIDSRGSESVSGLPDLCFVFDSSGSMAFSPAAEQGEYHIALLAFYSILHELEAKGLASLLRFNALNFSDTTFASGWRPYYEIEAVKRVLLQHQNGGTKIDVGKLAAIRHERKDSYLLFLLSDLDISNVSELEAELIKTHQSKAAHVSIFKLGGENLLSARLEEAGMNIFYIRTAADFMKGSITIARTVYSGRL